MSNSLPKLDFNKDIDLPTNLYNNVKELNNSILDYNETLGQYNNNDKFIQMSHNINKLRESILEWIKKYDLLCYFDREHHIYKTYIEISRISNSVSLVNISSLKTSLYYLDYEFQLRKFEKENH